MTMLVLLHRYLVNLLQDNQNIIKFSHVAGHSHSKYLRHNIKFWLAHFCLVLGPSYCSIHNKICELRNVHIKIAPYDTIQLRSGPSWLDKDCSEFGSPFFPLPGARVPLTSILNQIHLEAIFCGIETTLRKLPPYFISRATSISGREGDLMEDLDSASKEDSGIISNHLK